MAEVIVFHHALGLTSGVASFADELRAHGHEVTVPDLYEGATFTTVDEGVEHARSVGMDAVIDRGVAAAEQLPAELVYVGFSLGVMPAQKLAQARPGARGAVLCHAGFPLGVFGTSWPTGVPLQLHVMADDPLGDVEEVEELGRSVEEAEVYLYPGSGHLFADRSSAEYDAAAAELLVARTLELLDRA